MKRANQERLGRAAARRAVEAADAANAAGSVAPKTPSPEALPTPSAAVTPGAEALCRAVLQVAGEVKALREALVQVGFAVTAGLQPPAIKVVSEKHGRGHDCPSCRDADGRDREVEAMADACGPQAAGPAPKPVKAEPPENAFTIQMARQAVLAYAAKAGAPKAGALLRERVGAAKVSDLKTPQQFAKVVEVFQAELRDLEKKA